jgi:hypothetical protein
MNRSRFRLGIVLAVVVPVVGCTSIQDWIKDHNSSPKGSETLKPVPAESLVAYINDRAAKLQTIEYADIRVVARDGLITFPGLRGSLTAAQPRYFRMTGTGGAVGAKVDLGSNPDRFWAYFDGPGGPVYVFASHTEFEAGKAPLPGGIPFEPDWVMEALGMTRLPPTNQYSAPPPDAKHRTYSLTWPALAPGGPPTGKDGGARPALIPVVKEVVFDADPAADPKPQVKKHVIRDAKNNVICSAEIKQAKTVPAGPDPRGPTVQYPTVVVLRWDQKKFELELDLKAGEVNKPLTEETSRRLFTPPTIPNASPIDLAQYKYPQK